MSAVAMDTQRHIDASEDREADVQQMVGIWKGRLTRDARREATGVVTSWEGRLAADMNIDESASHKLVTNWAIFHDPKATPEERLMAAQLAMHALDNVIERALTTKAVRYIDEDGRR